MVKFIIGFILGILAGIIFSAVMMIGSDEE